MKVKIGSGVTESGVSQGVSKGEMLSEQGEKIVWNKGVFSGFGFTTEYKLGDADNEIDPPKPWPKSGTTGRVHFNVMQDTKKGTITIELVEFRPEKL